MSHMKEPLTPQKEYIIEKVEPNDSAGYLFFKRLFDILASFLLGIILLPVMLLIALAIKLDSRGSALYVQERLGKNGKPFRVLKFRTMYKDAEKEGPRWAELDDSRCTKVGRVLRKYHLDEFPQLWNIFLGHMSFVGPRPERPCFYETFETYIHGFSHRLAVKPGLTGLAQLRRGYDCPPEEKIIHDMEYIETSSFMLDLKLCFLTLRLFFPTGRKNK